MFLNSKSMKQRFIFYLACILSVFIVNACNKNNGKKQNNSLSTVEYMIENQNRKYSANLSKFDTSLTQHFPESLDTTNLQVLSGSFVGVNMNYLEITNKISDKTISQKFANSSIDAYAGDDTCILAFYHFDSWKEYPETKFEQCLIDRYLIPDFRGNKYRDLGTESRLPNDFMIYVLDSQSDNNMPDSLILGNDDLLEKWGKGFSRGVAISEEKMVIIYWVITWE